MIKLAGQVGSASLIMPMYEQIAADIRALIASGEWPPGHQLPTVNALMAQYNCGTTAIRNAMLLLRSEGLIEGRQGKGVYVAAPRT